jgi:hypothetical protein
MPRSSAMSARSSIVVNDDSTADQPCSRSQPPNWSQPIRHLALERNPSRDANRRDSLLTVVTIQHPIFIRNNPTSAQHPLTRRQRGQTYRRHR